MGDQEICNLCGQPIAPGEIESWIGPQGEEIKITNSLLPSALLETPEGDIDICGECYPPRVEERFHGKVLAEVHYQFGLTFRHRQDDKNASISFRRAIDLNRTANYLAALAGTVDSRDESDRLNREAILLDPDCDIARNNLARSQEIWKSKEDEKHR